MPCGKYGRGKYMGGGQYPKPLRASVPKGVKTGGIDYAMKGIVDTTKIAATGLVGIGMLNAAGSLLKK